MPNIPLKPIYHRIRFELAYARQRRPKRRGAVRLTPQSCEAMVRELTERGWEVKPFQIDVAGYRDYLARADYARFEDYYARPGQPWFHEKSLEHYLAAFLLDLGPDDVYIDVANAHSPAPDVYERLFGCEVYRQDMIYAAGIEGNVIGGDAAQMPLPDGFAGKMALHCSFEHFEGDSDADFIREARRVLRPGGRVCILPLYLFQTYAIQTDPLAQPPGGMDFEPDATLHCVQGYINRHGRFYDADHLERRIVSNLGDLKMTLYDVRNTGEVDASCYLRFMMVLEKPADSEKCEP